METIPHAVYTELTLSEIGLNYSRLRIIDPKTDAIIAQSLRKHGQIMPVIVGKTPENKYEIIDGFKRFRACEQLGYEKIQAKVMEGKGRVFKAAIISLNTESRSIADFEKGLVIRSLHREDGMHQDEIAVLLGYHKSWVCRRLLLVERLDEEVQEHFKLGLINISTCRQLAQLPRGNQSKALKPILKYHFTAHEVARLVSILMNNPRWNHETILDFPEEILSDRQPPRPVRNTKSERVVNSFMKIERILASEIFSLETLQKLTSANRDVILSIIKRIEAIIFRIKMQLEGNDI